MLWATNDEILFVSDRSGLPTLWMISAGGSDPTQVTQGVIPVAGATLSADGRTLVYLQKESIQHIWISALDGGNAHQVTADEVRVETASFSPDGKHISSVFLDAGNSNPEAHLYVMDRDGTNQRQLTSASEAILACSWSLDGKWLAYSPRGLGELEDSSSVYLLQPFNPGRPRQLCKGVSSLAWVDSERVVVFSRMKTLQYSLNGSSPTQVYQDSTFAVPILGDKLLLVYDFRMGRTGWWTVWVDASGKQKAMVKQIVPPDLNYAAPSDRRFMIYRKQEGDELWRVWTSSGKEERIGRALPGEAYMQHVSLDGKEILWVRSDIRSKIVLVKNVFE